MTEPTWLIERRKEHDAFYVPVWGRDLGDLESHDPLTRDVAFNRHSMNDGHHVSPSDNSTMQIGTDEIRVALVQGINEDAFRRTLSAATRATIGIDITPKWELCTIGHGCGFHTEHKTEPDGHAGTLADPYNMYGWKDPLEPETDWEEMMKGGLQTALESQTVIFAVSGVSRTCTHQLVRSRRAAFHQQSQRASYVGDGPEFRMPESVWLKPEIRALWFKAVMASWQAYRGACEADVSYQDARFILPEGTTNFIMLEYPVREFLNVYAYRACHMFQWEIASVMHKCRDELIAAHPWLEPYVKITCEKTKVCEFQGWENVEGQCSLPWAKEDNRRFKPVHHRIGKKD